MAAHTIDQDLPPLQQRRLAARLSRERLGARAGGVTAGTIFRIERGLVRPHPATLTALARALDCEVADLLSDREEDATQAP